MQRLTLLIMLFSLASIGCADRRSPSHLVVHCHKGLYDFLDRDGIVLHRAESIDEFKAAIQKTKFQKLIAGKRITVRFEGLRSKTGLGIPENVVQVISELAGAGSTRQDWDYTND